MRQGFIGFGNLAKAIYQGLKEDKNIEFAYFDIIKKDIDIPHFENMESLVSFADVIWLTVKPQNIAEILEELKLCKIKEKTVASPVAGKTIAYIEHFLGGELPIVRIMPNLAIAYRRSVTAFTTNQPDNSKTIDIFNLLGRLGKVVRLDESSFDLFTSVFGSGPAFILAFIQIFKNKMHEFNLPGQLPDELLLELIQGTTIYFAQNRKNHTIEELIENITSKGGTTQAGLDYFRTHEIGKLIEGVIDAARDRSTEMSRNGN